MKKLQVLRTQAGLTNSKTNGDPCPGGFQIAKSKNQIRSKNEWLWNIPMKPLDDIFEDESKEEFVDRIYPDFAPSWMEKYYYFRMPDFRTHFWNFFIWFIRPEENSFSFRVMLNHFLFVVIIRLLDWFFDIGFFPWCISKVRPMFFKNTCLRSGLHDLSSALNELDAQSETDINNDRNML